MNAVRDETRIRPGWWTLIFVATLALLFWLVGQFFNGSFRDYVPVTLTADRAGLVMETDAKVKMRGVQVGRVGGINGNDQPVRLKLEIDPEAIKDIPANVQARIEATTVFGAKYVELIYPSDPTPKRLAPGSVLRSENVTTEVNTVFQNLVGVINQVNPAKLNGVLSALADGVRGQGERIGEATTDANQVVQVLNSRSSTIKSDWRAVKDFSDTYGTAAQDILHVLSAASTTSTTITHQQKDLDALLLNLSGFAQRGINVIGPNRDNLVNAINVLQPTADLLMKYNPELTCVLQGGKVAIDTGLPYYMGGGNGKSLIVDAALLLGDDPYRYPDNLPINAAKGGPGGKPGCGSLPDVVKNFPVRQLITNTGWGTGVDWRPNPGIGFPGWSNYFPFTKGMPEPPRIRYPGGPAPGPIPYPGAPPYGAPQYGPDGTPRYPGVPPAPLNSGPPPAP
ncbi:MCE family protein [Mycobacterium sp. 050134]|uniref:MCE family protein n=1 Tax=Mycobacterium sp. 050134 TaxID=3096111 RepID=UPI002ED921BA